MMYCFSVVTTALPSGEAAKGGCRISVCCNQCKLLRSLIDPFPTCVVSYGTRENVVRDTLESSDKRVERACAAGRAEEGTWL